MATGWCSNQIFAVVAAVSLSGCMPWVQDQLYRDVTIGPLEISDAEVVSSFGNDATRRICFSAESVGQSNAATCEQGRNILASKLVKISEEGCRTHMRNIVGNENAVNVVFGSGALAASSLATILARPEAKTIAAGISTLLGAERSLISEQVYKNKVGEAVITTILGDRKTLIDELEALEKMSIRDANVLKMESKVRAFHNACSFEVAVSKLVVRGTASSVAKLQ